MSSSLALALPNSRPEEKQNRLVRALPQMNSTGVPMANEAKRISTIDFHISERRNLMPGKKHVRGVGAKEQRQYEHIKEEAQKSGRYGKRASEVAARTVLKQHAEKGHKKNQ